MTLAQRKALDALPTSTVRTAVVDQSSQVEIVYLENGRRFLRTSEWRELDPVPGTMAAYVHDRAATEPEAAHATALAAAPF